jgi:hypothetical protein
MRRVKEELSALTCGGCGARLSVAGAPKFVDCRFCGASLRVNRTESAITTEVLERVEELGAEVADLRKSDRLQALDMEWEGRRAWYRSQSKFDLDKVRSQSTFAAVGIMLPMLVLFLFMVNLKGLGRLGFGEILIVLVGVVGGSLVHHFNHRFADRYDRELAEYREKRRAIEEE